MFYIANNIFVPIKNIIMNGSRINTTPIMRKSWKMKHLKYVSNYRENSTSSVNINCKFNSVTYNNNHSKSKVFILMYSFVSHYKTIELQFQFPPIVKMDGDLSTLINCEWARSIFSLVPNRRPTVKLDSSVMFLMWQLLTKIALTCCFSRDGRGVRDPDC